MSNNKKAIFICMFALVAMVAFLVMKGNGSDPEARNVTSVSESELEFQVETPMVDETVPPKEMHTNGTLPATDNPARKENRKKKVSEKKEEKNGDQKKNAHSGKDSPNQADKKTSSMDKEDSKGKTEKPSHANLSKKSNKKVEEENGKTSFASASPAPTIAVASEEPEKKECKLTITCHTVFEHMDKVSERAKKVIPTNGIFFEGNVTVNTGDTVFDVMKRVCEENGILLDYVFTPMYATYYIKGIGNLYEFDCGAESGWMYLVDGKNSGHGCSQYKLTGGEEVTFYYTCER